MPPTAAAAWRRNSRRARDRRRESARRPSGSAAPPAPGSSCASGRSRTRPCRTPRAASGVGEPGDADRRQPGARLDPVDERLDRLPERRAQRRARAALAVAPLEVVVALAEPRPHGGLRLRLATGRAGAGSRRSPRSAPGSRSASARPRSSSARPSSRAAARPSPPRPGRSERASASASLGAGHGAGHGLEKARRLGIEHAAPARSSPSRSMSRAALTSALSAIAGIDPCPLRPWTRRTNGELRFSADASRGTALARRARAVAGALVHGVVGSAPHPGAPRHSHSRP